MLLFSIILYVFKFINSISYSSELRFVCLNLLYKLTRHFMNFSRSIVIRLDF